MMKKSLKKKIDELKKLVIKSDSIQQKAQLLLEFLKKLNSRQRLNILADSYFEILIPRVYYNLSFESYMDGEIFLTDIKKLYGNYDYIIDSLVFRFYQNLNEGKNINP